MRRPLCVLLALALAAAPAAATDKPPPVVQTPAAHEKWTGEDKTLHLMAGAALATASTIQWQSRAVGFGVGCGTGVAFELLAPAMNGVRSAKDAIVSCLGAAFGALIGGWHIDANPRGIRARKEF